MSISEAQVKAIALEFEKLKKQGNELIKKQNYRGAKEAYLRALENTKTEMGTGHDLSFWRLSQAQLWSNIALCEAKEDRWSEVVEAATHALEYDPKNIKSLYRRAQAHEALGNLKQSVADIRRCLEMDPKNSAILQFASSVQYKVQSQAHASAASEIPQEDYDEVCKKLKVILTAGLDPNTFESLYLHPIENFFVRIESVCSQPRKLKLLLKKTNFLLSLSEFLYMFISWYDKLQQDKSMSNLVKRSDSNCGNSEAESGSFDADQVKNFILWIQWRSFKVFNILISDYEKFSEQKHHSKSLSVDAKGKDGEANHACQVNTKSKKLILGPDSPPIEYLLHQSDSITESKKKIKAFVPDELLEKLGSIHGRAIVDTYSSAAPSIFFQKNCSQQVYIQACILEIIKLFTELYSLDDISTLKTFALFLDLTNNMVIAQQAITALGYMAILKKSVGSKKRALIFSQPLKKCIVLLFPYMSLDIVHTLRNCAEFALTGLMKLLTDKDRPSNECIDLDDCFASDILSFFENDDFVQNFIGYRILCCLYMADRKAFASFIQSHHFLTRVVSQLFNKNCSVQPSLSLLGTVVDVFIHCVEFPELRHALLSMTELSDQDILVQISNFSLVKLYGSIADTILSLKLAVSLSRIAAHDEKLRVRVFDELDFIRFGVQCLNRMQRFYSSEKQTEEEATKQNEVSQYFLELLLFLSVHGQFKKILLSADANEMREFQKKNPILCVLGLIAEHALPNEKMSMIPYFFSGIICNLLKSNEDKDNLKKRDLPPGTPELDPEQLEALQAFMDRLPPESRPLQIGIYDRGGIELSQKFASLIVNSQLINELSKILQSPSVSLETLCLAIEGASLLVRFVEHRQFFFKTNGIQGCLSAAERFLRASEIDSAKSRLDKLAGKYDEELSKCRQCVAQVFISINPSVLTYAQSISVCSHLLQLLEHSYELYQYEAALALTNLFAGSDHCRLYAIQKKAVVTFINLASSDNALCRAAGVEGACNLALCDEFHTHIAGGKYQMELQLLFAFLLETNNKRAQSAAAGCLAILSSDFGTIVKLVEVPNCHNIFRAIQNKNDFKAKPDLQTRILSFLQNVLTFAANKALEASFTLSFKSFLKNAVDVISQMSQEEIDPNATMVYQNVFQLGATCHKENYQGVKKSVSQGEA